jgi:phosphoribosylformylglycinamidine (FGAM) synthase PurS component
MARTYLFEIGYKAGVADPVGQGLKRDITHLGLARVKNVSSAQLYKVSGQISAEERNRIAKDLLCDPIIQECGENIIPHPAPSPSEGRGGPKIPLPSRERLGEGWSIDIWYKQGVTDAVGDSVRKGIQDLAISGVQDVRTGMRYHLEGVAKRDVAEKIALALLVNPLVHESTISTTGAPVDQAKRSARHAD